MIFVDRVMSRRISRFMAQILRELQTVTLRALLKALFSDKRLISSAKCRDSSELIGWR